MQEEIEKLKEAWKNESTVILERIVREQAGGSPAVVAAAALLADREQRKALQEGEDRKGNKGPKKFSKVIRIIEIVAALATIASFIYLVLTR